MGKISDYVLAIGPNGNLYVHVKGKPHLCYTLEAIVVLVAAGKIRRADD